MVPKGCTALQSWMWWDSGDTREWETVTPPRKALGPVLEPEESSGGRFGVRGGRWNR